jgi:hypothetical protein
MASRPVERPVYTAQHCCSRSAQAASRASSSPRGWSSGVCASPALARVNVQMCNNKAMPTEAQVQAQKLDAGEETSMCTSSWQLLSCCPPLAAAQSHHSHGTTCGAPHHRLGRRSPVKQQSHTQLAACSDWSMEQQTSSSRAQERMDFATSSPGRCDHAVMRLQRPLDGGLASRVVHNVALHLGPALGWTMYRPPPSAGKCRPPSPGPRCRSVKHTACVRPDRHSRGKTGYTVPEGESWHPLPRPMRELLIPS